MSKPPLPNNVIDPRTPPGPPRTESNGGGGGGGGGSVGSGVGSGGGGGGVGNVIDVRETHASHIALIITWTFAACSALILLGLFLILYLHPQNAESVLVMAGVPALKEAGSFLATVFGPLLAFVLGYYFGERKPRSQ